MAAVAMMRSGRDGTRVQRNQGHPVSARRIVSDSVRRRPGGHQPGRAQASGRDQCGRPAAGGRAGSGTLSEDPVDVELNDMASHEQGRGPRAVLRAGPGQEPVSGAGVRQRHAFGFRPQPHHRHPRIHGRSAGFARKRRSSRRSGWRSTPARSRVTSDVSEKDRREMERTMREEVLETARYPGDPLCELRHRGQPDLRRAMYA